MAPTASILIPTRGRPDYLAVALASIVPQADALGAEVIVVDDGPDYATRLIAERHGVRYLPHDRPRGLNAARNTAVEAAQGPLLAFVDDDVEVAPGWLRALLVGADRYPEDEVFGGPIRPRLEGSSLRMCGREGPPITFLDLGDEDADAEFVWGANMAIRRSAFDRLGPFDPALGGAGDEEAWQRAYRAAGGRIRYLAAAGLDHRRAEHDAQLRPLARAAYRRGRHSRRFDGHKQDAPSLARELRVLGGCLVHAARYRCENGLIMTAHSAGRVREALARR